MTAVENEKNFMNYLLKIFDNKINEKISVFTFISWDQFISRRFKVDILRKQLEYKVF
jgi:hypothetical protein